MRTPYWARAHRVRARDPTNWYSGRPKLHLLASLDDLTEKLWDPTDVPISTTERPINMAIAFMDDPMVLIPCDRNDLRKQLVIDAVLTEAGLEDECILSIRDLDGTLTHYAYAIPLSLAREANRRGSAPL